ncbi:MAG TPA: hypothetical protein VNA16_04765, partial [Abditibacteriaceae bacterium]|nr:hypothetical protein [Abditibacteriaceae bacterium]
RAGATGACGLVAGYRNAKDYAVFRWAGAGSTLSFRGRQQLVRFYKGKATIISDEPVTVVSGSDGFARVTVRLNAGALTVSAGGEIIAQMADETLAAGRPALWAEGATPAGFRDVVVFFPPTRIAPKVAPKMEGDTLMAGWASPAGEWPPSLSADGVEFWNTGEFFGDASLEYPWRRVAYGRGKLEFAVRAQRGNFATGTVVRCEGTGDDALVVTLLRGSTMLKQTRFAWKDLTSGQAPAENAEADAPIPLRVDLEGRAVLVSVGSKPVLSFLLAGRDGASPGTALAARASGFALRVKDLRAFSANRDDYTFTEAPTDWYAPQGNWSVTSRWPCTSDWSFFAGIGLNPVLWSKRTYGGDTVVEMYAHNQMDLPKETGYSASGNLNITIGGDGKNPSSGYSFVVGGWDYTRNAIFKGNRNVAENPAGGMRFPLPVNHNPLWHNRWAYIRAELRHTKKDGRDGVQISLSMDDEPLLEYFDAEPLPAVKRGGHVAFWTVDGTIMIARAKIESAEVGARALPVGLLDAAATVPDIKIDGDVLMPRALISDGLPSAVIKSTAAGGAAPDDAVWTISNPATGGLFAVQLVKPGAEADKPAPWRITPDTRFEMDVALPPEAKIDLYATINGERHLMNLSGNQKPDARVKLLGAVPEAPSTDTGEQGWRHVAFDLGAALKKLYPTAASWDVNELTLGALHGDEYRWLGFGGNPLGASYRLRGARLIGK